MGKRGRNLQSANQNIEGAHRDALNEMSPGLGDRISLLFNALGIAHDSTTGKHGTLVYVPQKGKDSLGKPDLIQDLNGGRVGNAGDAIDDQDYVTLRQFRARKDEEDEAPNALSVEEEVCQPTGMNNSETVDTGLTNIYAVQAQNEFVYVSGDNGSTGKFQVWRWSDDWFKIGPDLDTTEILTRMFIEGEYIFAISTGTPNLTIIDIRKPNAPVELSVFNVGSNTRAIHAQGRYAYVGADAGVRIVDAGDVGAPTVVGSI